VYVVRKAGEEIKMFQLDARVAVVLAMAEGFELASKDVVIVAASPLANWSRSLSLLIPGALTSAASVAKP
jgi:polysaccharide export outer membrane protein